MLFTRKKSLLSYGSPASYATDFRDTPLGTLPAGWAYRGTFGGGNSVETLAGSFSGRALRWPAGSGSALVPKHLPQRTDTEVLIRCQWSTNTSATGNFVHTMHRATVSDTASTRYLLALWNSANQTCTKGLFKDVSGTNTTIATGVQDLTGVDPGDWVWVRSRCDGNNLRIKYWLSGTSEPNAWLFETTDGDVGRAGFVGIVWPADPQIRWIDYFAVSFDWSTLPVPP